MHGNDTVGEMELGWEQTWKFAKNLGKGLMALPVGHVQERLVHPLDHPEEILGCQG